MNIEIIEKLKLVYLKEFGKEPDLIVRAPGRINLLGEHTDYNNGFVLPGAIDKAIYIAGGLSNDKESTVISADFNDKDHFSFSGNIPKSDKNWSNYIRGVAVQLFAKAEIKGQFNAVFGGDIPIGSGLSSSAALECGFGFLFNELFNCNAGKLEIALAGQSSEHNFIGVKCGIMDQFASVFGKEDHLIKLDCRDMTYGHFPLKLNDYHLVLIHSGVHHELASSEYNTRREQCETGVKAISELLGKKKESLRDVTLEELLQCKGKMPEIVFKRCFYVVSENERVEEIVKSLEKQDLKSVGEIMYRTHEGLSKDYEVSCEELDFLVDQTKTISDVLGSRMMGGGFGGCTINLIKKTNSEEVIQGIQNSYQERYKKIPQVIFVSLGQGVEKK